MKKIAQACVMAILCLHLTNLFAQNNTVITGTVRNAAGQPLGGASITNTRIGKGAQTNAAGVFTLHGAKAGDMLRISYIGYAAQTITLGKETDITITLQDATNELDRVVVQAYGITSDRLRTGNIGKLTAADIEKQPVMNVLDALQGKIPGVAVTHNNGYTSGTIKVEVRGRNTINPNIPSDPLYIIDGVPLTILDLLGYDSYSSGSRGAIQSGINSPATGQSPLFNITPNDIESVEVLKDADATAIYGSRAANGVVLITTKKGSAGKVKTDGNFSTGFMQIARYYPIMNTQQYVAMRREALTNDGLPVNAQTAPDLVVWDSTKYTDWQKYLWGNLGHTTTASATFSGGDRRATFRISGNYQSRADILAISGKNLRGGLSFNLNNKSLNNKFLIGLTGMYNRTWINTISNPPGVNLPPNAPDIFAKDGALNYAGWTPLATKFIFQYLRQKYRSETDLFNSSLFMSYEIINGLAAKVSFGYNIIQARQNEQKPAASQNPLNNPLASAKIGYSTVRNAIVEPQLEYNGFLLKGRLNVLLGGSYQSNQTTSGMLQADNIPNDALIENLSSALQQSITNFGAQYKYLAAFGRINYLWNNRYILNLNMRRDGSSRFGPGRQFGNFASAGGAWIFSETRFIKEHVPFINFAKLRASFGTTGGDQIPDYQFQSAWTFGALPYDGVPTLFANRHYDSTIHWQVNKKLEVGLSLSFFKERLSLEASFYRNRCDNQLVSFPTPAFTGFTSVYTNSPANVENSGAELLLKAALIKTQPLSWLISANVGVNRNKLLSYPNIKQSPYAGLFEVGKPLSIVRVLHATGVDPQTGKYTFEDINGNNTVDIDYSTKTVDDRYILDLAPRFEGGFTNTVSYRNWSIDITFYFKNQKGRIPFASIAGFPGEIGNQPAEAQKRWTKPGDLAPIARYTTKPDASYNNYKSNSDGVYTNASFTRLQNFMLSYTVPPAVLKRIGIGTCRIYLQGQNVWLLTPYKGADPEIQSALSMSVPRIFVAGISINL